jgi:hypothetical protein
MKFSPVRTYVPNISNTPREERVVNVFETWRWRGMLKKMDRYNNE